MKKFLFFDLDGTLLPMDRKEFEEAYFSRMIRFIAPHGYDPHALKNAILASTVKMAENRSEATNEQIFWQTATQMLGDRIREDEPLFEDFYETDFQQIAALCPANPDIQKLIKDLKGKYRLVLATNPLFPKIATHSRIRWAGLEPEDFELITTYETCTRTKPDPAYFEEVLAKVGARPGEVIMIGNDTAEDLTARQAGIEVFLLTDCLINPDDLSLDAIPHGTINELRDWLEKQSPAA